MGWVIFVLEYIEVYQFSGSLWQIFLVLYPVTGFHDIGKHLDSSDPLISIQVYPIFLHMFHLMKHTKGIFRILNSLLCIGYV